MKREFRFNRDLELRREPGGRPIIRGYAARFNSVSFPISSAFGSFRERIRPGAFRNAIRGDVRALVNHDASKILGRTKSGTLTLREDNSGLYCEISPPDTSVGRDAVESVKRGDLDGMSFGFGVIDEDWSKTEDGQQVRELREVQLYDVSVVTYPAYPSTSVALRDLFPEGLGHIELRMMQAANARWLESKKLEQNRERQWARIALLRRL